jgi:tetratricopeptide (TPR) repeat protein
MLNEPPVTQDDTQPHVPLLNEDGPPPDYGPEGPGCFVWGLLAVVVAGMALVIVVLAATAGWTEGHRVSDRHATATQVEQINEQLRRIPTDVASGNQYLLNLRIGFLATLTPAVPVVADLQSTATAVYFNSQPTATPTVTPTAEVVATESPVVTTEPQAPTGYDLDGMLEEAQLDIRFGDYDAAYEKLDNIARIDPDFQRTTVRSLIFEALTAQAQQLFRTATEADLAEAIRLTGLAEEYGDIGELDYERLIAERYLDIQRTIGTGNHASAIRLLNDMIVNFQSTYKGIDFNRMLFNEYMAYGQAWEFGGQYCQAVVQYNFALNLFNDGGARAKRDAAQTICEQGTPTPIGGATPIGS